ncbi:hypothetical protein LINPERHAP2_LOCUS22075 [Linum perenne]
MNFLISIEGSTTLDHPCTHLNSFFFKRHLNSYHIIRVVDNLFQKSRRNGSLSLYLVKLTNSPLYYEMIYLPPSTIANLIIKPFHPRFC